MTEAARLVLIADSTSLGQGEKALDSLARTGSRVEGKLTVDMGSIEKAMARLGTTMGDLDRTMTQVGNAVSGAMGRTAQEAQRGARSFDDLRRSIDPAYAASARFSDVQRELAGMVASGAAAQDQANQVLEVARSRYLGIATSAEQAEQAQREQAQALALATGNFQSLRAAVDPLYAASKRYEAALETANAALKAKIITEQEHARVMKLAETQMLTMPEAAGKAGDGVAKFGMVANQVGFQLQDVFVSGPMIGWFRAVAQQAPQAAGAFAMLGGSIGTIVPWIGTAIAVGAALVPMFVSTGASAEDAADALDRATNSLNGYTDAAGRAGTSVIGLAQIFRRDAVGAINAITSGFVDNAESLSFWQKRANELSGQTQQLLKNTDFGNMRAFEQAVGNVADRLGITTQAAATFMAEMDRIGDLSSGSGLEDMRDHLDAVAKALETAAGGSISMNELSKTQYTDILTLLDQVERKIEERAAAETRAINAVEQAIGKYDQQAAMQQAIARYGAESAQVEALKRDEAARAAQALLEQHNISGPLADQLMRSAAAAYDAAYGADQAAISLRNAEAAARALAAALSAAAGFSAGIDNQIQVIEARIAAQRSGADAAIAGQRKSMELQAEAHRQAMIAAGESDFAAQTAYLRDMARIGQLSKLTGQEKALAEANRETARASKRGASAAKKGASEAEKASKKAAAEAKRTAEALDKEAEKWGELLSPVKKYQNAMKDLAALKGRLSDDEMAEAQKRLNVELADSIPLAGEFVDTVTEGLLNGFTGTLDSIKAMFKRWLAQMIAAAAKNRIMVSMGMGGVGGMMGGGDALSSALGAAGAPVGGVGGVMSGIAGGLSAFGGGLWSGAGSVMSGVMSGGLSGGISAIGTALSGATAGLAGLGAALGAVALPLAAVAAVFSFFKTKTKQLDAGLRVTIDGMEALTETFNKVEKKRFWGLSKKVRTYYDDADAQTQRAVEGAINGLQAGVLSAAKVLGFGAQTFKDFAHSLQVSTKGMSEEEAQKALMEVIGGVSDAYAKMVPGLMRFAQQGETATEVLNRLSQSLVGVNGIMDTLGHGFRAVGLKGAALASDIAALFGGLEAMASATQRYYETFYTEAERLKTTTRQTRAALADLGLAMPKTRAEYRAIIEAMDLTTEKGRKAYAALISVADAMDVILPKAAEFTAQMERLQNRVVTQIGKVIGDLNDAIRANQAAASDWRKAGDGIRDYLDKLRGTASALISPMQARAYNQAVFRRTLQAARGGDAEAAGRLPGAAGNYLGSVNDTAKSRAEAALAQARVAVQMGKVAIKADATATALERVAGLQQRQVDILTRVQEYIAAGNSLTKDGITKLLGQIEGLEGRITLQGTNAIVAPMANLRGALVDLRNAIVAEDKRRADAVKKVAKVTNKPPQKATAPKPATPTKPRGYTSSDYTYRSLGYDDRRDTYRTVVTGPLGGSRIIDGRQADVYAWLRKQNYPAFAQGGLHRGGPAHIAEDAPELVAPSRIYNPAKTRAMLDNREVVAELRALRKELEDVTTFTRKTAESTTRTSNDMKRGFVAGFPTVPAEE